MKRKRDWRRPRQAPSAETELRRRYTFWQWLPPREREQLVKAQAEGDQETLARLRTRGQRRELLREWTVCVKQWLPWKVPECNCTIRALENDELFAYLVPDASKAPLGAHSNLAYFAQRLHDDPAFDVAGHIAAKTRERIEREARAAAGVAAPSPPKKEKQPRKPKRMRKAKAQPQAAPEPPYEIPESWRWRSQQQPRSPLDDAFESDYRPSGDQW
jgi:hypothetical protein